MSATVTRVVFGVDDLDDVLAAMARYTDAHRGWVNLTLDIDPADLPPAPSLISQLFRSSGPTVALGTWTPPDARHPDGPQTIGLQHQLGTALIPHLDALGLERHERWKRIQDSPRRGLVAAIPADVPHRVVVEWLMAATKALTPVESTGRWEASLNTAP